MAHRSDVYIVGMARFTRPVATLACDSFQFSRRISDLCEESHREEQDQSVFINGLKQGRRIKCSLSGLVKFIFILRDIQRLLRADDSEGHMDQKVSQDKACVESGDPEYVLHVNLKQLHILVIKKVW